jgi:hypothetical protein
MDSKRPFYQLVIGWLVVVTVITAIALLRPSPVLSDVDLTQAVNSAFLARAEDPALHDLAHQRALEASVNFSHVGATMTEVLAWNQGMADPVSTVITQWLESPAHLAILSDPRFDRIGCGSVTTSDGRYFAACTLSRGEAPPAGTQSIPSVKEPSEPATATADRTPALLPNTALRTP